MSEKFERPALTEEDIKTAKADAQKLMRKYGLSKLPEMLNALILENVRLTKEIQEHRAARGIEPLKTFEV